MIKRRPELDSRMPEPSSPLPAASVILLDAQQGRGEPFGLFLLRRRAGSSFMPDRFVFPGGRVEPSDGEDPLALISLRRAALRELWEEAGVILADDPARAAATARGQREEVRAALQKGRLGLDQALAGLGLGPDLGALLPYARWITPPTREQRFDTTFFLAAMPAGQRAESDDAETSQGLWLGPAPALQGNQEGRVSLAAPQVRLLGELSRYGSLEKLLARDSGPLDPVRPVLWASGKTRVVMLPWDPDYAAGQPGPDCLPGQPCPAHQASRIVNFDGRWLPYTCRR
ncbi:MAG: NUDIX hydrolase [Desulfarculus sp.]|nr:MAG: NUDIX hydrolase [Desulfarculus sp.]